MELKHRDYKYINNTRSLPKFDPGKPGESTQNPGTSENGMATSKWSGVGTAIQGAANTAAAIYDAHQYTNTSQDFINKYGTTSGSYGDIGYTKYNDINKPAEMAIEHRENVNNTLKTVGIGAGTGAAIGTAILPGVGSLVGAGVGALAGFVGGLFGSGSRHAKAKRELELAQQRVDNYNDMNRSGAMTASLQQDQALLYGDTRSLTLFSAKFGKDEVNPITKSTVNKHKVETSGGLRYDNQNSWVSQGEGIWNPSTDFANYITHGPNDTARANLKRTDVVFGSTKNPLTGNTFKEDAAPLIIAKQELNKKAPKSTGYLSKQTKDVYNKATQPIQNEISSQLQYLANIQRLVHADEEYEGLMHARKGKNAGDLPKFKKDDPFSALSPWPNILSSGAGFLTGLGQYMDAKNDTPYMPNTYVANPYTNRGLNTLAGLRVSPYPIMQQLRDAEARNNYAINASGGLSTGQRQIGRIASLANTQQSIANALMSIQAQNNKYRSDYATAAMQQGEADAQRRQRASQYDLDYYSKAHAARQQGMQTGMYNMVAALNKFADNENNRILNKYSLGLFLLLMDNDKPSQTQLFSDLKHVDPVNVASYTPTTVENNIPKLDDVISMLYPGLSSLRHIKPVNAMPFLPAGTSYAPWINR